MNGICDVCGRYSENLTTEGRIDNPAYCFECMYEHKPVLQVVPVKTETSKDRNIRRIKELEENEIKRHIK